MYEKLLIKLVEPIIGKNNLILIDLLKDKKDVNEFKLAQKVGLTINQVRNLLYKLYSHNIVSFVRKKDKRKGWYIYFWTLNKHKVLELAKNQGLKELEQLRHTLKSREHKRFYICKECGIELAEENALHNEYLCTECGQLLHLKEDKAHLNDVIKQIDRVKKEIITIDNELEKIKLETEAKAAKEKKKVKKGKKKKAKGKKKIKKVKKKPRKKKVKKVKKKKAKKKVKHKAKKKVKKKAKKKKVKKKGKKR
ncbi:hypothetical protein HZA33_04665 [Candidatus Pacearchaeota archaeon]|nr:hypothetical protein [Candidatus Pacearchaeota archaeon]